MFSVHNCNKNSFKKYFTWKKNNHLWLMDMIFLRQDRRDGRCWIGVYRGWGAWCDLRFLSPGAGIPSGPGRLPGESPGRTYSQSTKQTNKNFNEILHQYTPIWIYMYLKKHQSLYQITNWYCNKYIQNVCLASSLVWNLEMEATCLKWPVSFIHKKPLQAGSELLCTLISVYVVHIFGSRRVNTGYHPV